MHERRRVRVVSLALLPAPAVLDATAIASDHVLRTISPAPSELDSDKPPVGCSCFCLPGSCQCLFKSMPFKFLGKKRCRFGLKGHHCCALQLAERHKLSCTRMCTCCNCKLCS